MDHRRSRTSRAGGCPSYRFPLSTDLSSTSNDGARGGLKDLTPCPACRGGAECNRFATGVVDCLDERIDATDVGRGYQGLGTLDLAGPERSQQSDAPD